MHNHIIEKITLIKEHLSIDRVASLLTGAAVSQCFIDGSSSHCKCPPKFENLDRSTEKTSRETWTR